MMMDIVYYLLMHRYTDQTIIHIHIIHIIHIVQWANNYAYIFLRYARYTFKVLTILCLSTSQRWVDKLNLLLFNFFTEIGSAQTHFSFW